MFDLISDLHIDYWIAHNSPHSIPKKRIEEFLSGLLPKNPSNTLVIAGDLGSFDNENIECLIQLKKIYKNILVVFGNHDITIKPKNPERTLKPHDRIKRLSDFCENTDGLHFLNGNIVEIEGIKYGGCGMWCDFSYAAKHFNTPTDYFVENFYNKPNSDPNGLITIKEPLAFFEEEKQKLRKIVDKSDVIITHVSPDDSVVLEKYHSVNTGSFYFDGSEFFDKLTNKIWCFGHTHEAYNYNKYGCHFICNPLGFPYENTGKIRRIITVNT